MFRETNSFPRLGRRGNPILTVLHWFIFRYDGVCRLTNQLMKPGDNFVTFAPKTRCMLIESTSIPESVIKYRESHHLLLSEVYFCTEMYYIIMLCNDFMYSFSVASWRIQSKLYRKSLNLNTILLQWRNSTSKYFCITATVEDHHYIINHCKPKNDFPTSKAHPI